MCIVQLVRSRDMPGFHKSDHIFYCVRVKINVVLHLKKKNGIPGMSNEKSIRWAALSCGICLACISSTTHTPAG